MMWSWFPKIYDFIMYIINLSYQIIYIHELLYVNTSIPLLYVSSWANRTMPCGVSHLTTRHRQVCHLKFVSILALNKIRNPTGFWFHTKINRYFGNGELANVEFWQLSSASCEDHIPDKMARGAVSLPQWAVWIDVLPNDTDNMT